MIVLEKGWRRELSAEALKTSIAGPADNGPSDTRAGKWSIGTNGRNCIEKRCHPTKYFGTLKHFLHLHFVTSDFHLFDGRFCAHLFLPK